MRSFSIFTSAFLASTAVGAPAVDRRQSDFSPNNVYFPLKDGFPNPSNDQVMQIQKNAFGTLPNAGAPPKVSDEGITNLKLIALNELFEVAFFSELVYNVTNKFKGYDMGYGQEYVLDALNAIIAQEELHLLNANGALKAFNKEPIQPCKYNFPVTDFQSAITLASIFTDVVLGTLQDVIQVFAQGGDAGLARAVASVIGNEAEQDGFFKLVQKRRPSSQPFLTTGVRDFAFTAIQSFTIPGSCPNINTIPLKTFKPLNVVSTNIKPATQNLQFSFKKSDLGSAKTSDLKIAFINQQNKPVIKSLDNVQNNDVVTFSAAFPYDEFLMSGLTLAAVISGNGPFANANDVAKATIFGPGLIEI